MILLIDADILAYRIGWATHEEPESWAIHALNSFIATRILFEFPEVTPYVMYLTGSSSSNFRHQYAVTLPYKGNRKDQEKPKHYDAIREYLVDRYDAVVVEGEEADDRIAIEATRLGDEAIMCSVDKDFKQVPGNHFNFVSKSHFQVESEEGLRFLYQQILTGDSTDNIPGIFGVGPKKADKILEECEDEGSMYVACILAYRDKMGLTQEEAKARVLETARLVYLRRRPGEVWCSPFDRLT